LKWGFCYCCNCLHPTYKRSMYNNRFHHKVQMKTTWISLTYRWPHHQSSQLVNLLPEYVLARSSPCHQWHRAAYNW
jgi:hypothetical protein